jgi:hypothetical protein
MGLRILIPFRLMSPDAARCRIDLIIPLFCVNSSRTLQRDATGGTSSAYKVPLQVPLKVLPQFGLVSTLPPPTGLNCFDEIVALTSVTWTPVPAGNMCKLLFHVCKTQQPQDRVRKSPGCYQSTNSAKSAINGVIELFTGRQHYGHHRAVLRFIDPQSFVV